MKLNIKKIIEVLLLTLVFVLPFNFRYILNFENTQELLFFKENLTYSLYLFDLLFLIILPLWLLKRFKFLKNKIFLFLIAIYLILNSFFVAFSLFPALYSSLRILEVLIFFLIFIDVTKNRKFFNKAVYLIFISGVIQSVIALFQFILQKSLNLKYFGESVLNPEILGVAKLEIEGEKFIRAYGTFPHPNLLGTFLFLALIAGLYFVLNQNFKIPFKNHQKIKKIKLRPFHLNLIQKIHFYAGLMLIFIGIVTTFSRSIWLITTYLAFLMLLRYLKYLFNKKYLLKYLLPIIIFLMIILVGFYQFIPARICSTNCQDQSLALRQSYADFSELIIQNNLVFGIGIGQFTSEFKKINPANLAEWNIQPVHNLYLLTLSEIGLMGFLLIFAFIIRNTIPINLSAKNEIFLIGFGGFVILGIFDHYFWTIPQGQFIFWLALALLVSSVKINK